MQTVESKKSKTKSKKSMSSSDITLILQEIQDKIVNYSIDNIYELNEIYVLRLKGTTIGFPRMVSLVIEPGKRIHLTEYKRSFPEIPSDKVLTFRKFIKKGRVTKLRQHGNDRIIVFEIFRADTERSFSLFCELFGKGNIILVEHLKITTENPIQNRVLYALWYRIMRDRRLLPGKEFVFPPTRGKAFLDIIAEDLNSLDEPLLNDQIVKVLVRNFGTSGEVVEEILAVAKIIKNKKASDIIPAQSNAIILSIEKYKQAISNGPPQILHENETESGINVLPYPYASISEYRREEFPTFNKACDQFFSPRELLSSSAAELAQESRLKQFNKTLEKQKSHLQTLISDADRKKVLGNYMYENAHVIEELFATIRSANKKGMSWEEIENRLELGKQKNIASAQILDQINYRNKEVRVNLTSLDSAEVISFTLDFTKSPYELGLKQYDKAKKARRKIEPAKKAIEITKLKLKESTKLKDQAQAITKAKAVKKRSKLWYESNHWSRTKKGLLIIAGRDLKSNEKLAKRHLDKNDIFFHADVQGASYTILKVNETDLDLENSEPTEEDYLDAAIIAGSYSKAWRAGLGSVDVYSVKADQVSFSAPSGEYLPKGGISVTGRRQFYKVALKLWLGVYFDEIYAYLFVSGNEKVVKLRSVTYAAMTSSQGGDKKGEIAKKIQNYFEKTVPDEDIFKLKTLQLSDYVQCIP